MTVDYKAIVSVCNFHYNTALNMKTQPIYILLSLPGMLLTLQHVEGVLGDEAIQPNSKSAMPFNFISSFNISYFVNLSFNNVHRLSIWNSNFS